MREKIPRREWQRVVLFAGAVMLVTVIPYMVGWLSAGDGWEFGGFLFGVDDGYSYIAKMRLGARGDWLFIIRYTSEPHDGALLFLPYILLGKLTGLFVDSRDPALATGLAVTFQMARIAFGFLLILVTYRFVAFFLRRPASRMLALVLITLGGGLGWLLSLMGLGDLFDSLPLDFYVPESYSFLILFGLPHLALARSGMLLGFLLVFHTLEKPDTPRSWLRRTVLAGLCWVVMGLCVPFYVAVLYAILGTWGLAAWLHDRRFPWALFWRVTSAALVASPVLLYSTVVFAASDVLRQWSSQNLLPSPHPLHYVLGYCVIVIPAVWGWRWAWNKSQGQNGLPYLLLVTWVVIVPVLVYLPINVQRRLAEGAFVPLGILAAAGLRLISPARRVRRRARNLVVTLSLLTAVLLWIGATFSSLTPDRPQFRPTDELDALDALNAYAEQDTVVLSSKESGNYLPARTDLKAYVGHGPETINSEEKEEWAEQFFAGTLDPETRRDLLAQVDFVFYGPLEAEFAGTSSAWTEGLRLLPMFDPGDLYRVYEVPHD